MQCFYQQTWTQVTGKGNACRLRFAYTHRLCQDENEKGDPWGYLCETLAEFVAMVPEAESTLDEIRVCLKR